MLRRVVTGVLAVVVLATIGAVALGLTSAPFGVLYLGAEAAIVLVLLLIERGRYQPKATSGGGTWEATNERFQDPASGRWTRVEFNPTTGERRYREE